MSVTLRCSEFKTEQLAVNAFELRIILTQAEKALRLMENKTTL